MRFLVPVIVGISALGALGIAYMVYKTGPFVQSYWVPSSSMRPTLMIGDVFFVAREYYAWHTPVAGDVVMFYVPDADYIMIKRVVAGPGDRVKLEHGRLYLNGLLVDRKPADIAPAPETGDEAWQRYVETLPNGRSYTILEQSDEGWLDTFPEMVVPAGEYFMLGDNRDVSRDSRSADLGTVPLYMIANRPSFIYMSRDIRRIGLDIQP
ncbi:MAG TPA: signal peptidase I [Dongiaceae bacterium]|nr:signal peptidase I [Dongiaceae bacterium]